MAFLDVIQGDDDKSNVITWASTPTEGNLLLVVAADRAGGADYGAAPSGWTELIEVRHNPTNGTERLNGYLYARVAGASESTTATFSADADFVSGVELDADGKTFTLGSAVTASVSGNSGTGAPVGPTSSLSEDTYIAIGYGVHKSNGGEPFGSWTSIALTSKRTWKPTGVNQVQPSVAAADLGTTSGTKSTTGTLDASDTIDRSGLLGLAVLPYSTGGGTPVSVTAVEGAATAAGEVPTVEAKQLVSITAVEGAATAVGEVPTVAALQLVSVVAVEGEATAAGEVPTVAALRLVSVTAVEGAATAAGEVPTVVANSSSSVAVAAVEGEATAVGEVPTVAALQLVSIVAVEGEATAVGEVPTVAALQLVSITAVEGEATAVGEVPTVEALRLVSIVAVEGQATAAGEVPTVEALANGAVAITAVEGEATAAGEVPTVAALQLVAVTAPEGEATAAGEVPTVAALQLVSITAVEGEATAAGEVPTVVALASVAVAITAVEGSATAAGEAPTVVALPFVANLFPPEGEATAEGIPPTVVAAIYVEEQKRRKAGWKNPLRASDPQLQKTFDSITSWSAKLGAGCRIHLGSTNQTISSGTATDVSWFDVQDDSDNFFDAASPTLLTVPVGLDGIYVLSGAIHWDEGLATVTRRRQGYTVTRSGVEDETFVTDMPSNGIKLEAAAMPTVRLGLRSGDSIAVFVFQNSGVDLDIRDTSQGTSFVSLVRVGDFRQ